MPTSSDSRSVAHFGVFAADLSARRLFKHGIEIRLQEQPFQVLALLLERPSELVSREELRQQLWPMDTFVAFDEGLNNAVNRLRRALGDTADNPRFIETIPRQGYRFIAPVVEPEPKLETEDVANPPIEESPKSASWGQIRKSWVRLALPALAALVLAASGFYFFRLQRNSGGNLQAIQECQQGRELWRQRTPETLASAITHFNKSVTLNPSYAPAYSGLADAYLVLPLLSSVSQEEAYPKAREAAANALTLDPLLAEAHSSAADVKLYVDWDFSGAEREFHRAIELNPNYATAHQWYAEYLSLMGRHEEAIGEIQRAQKLEPLSVIMYHQAGQIYQNARQYDKAIEQYNRALEISPGFNPSAGRLTDALRHHGLFSEALETEKELLKHGGFYDPGGAPAIAVEERTQGYKTRGSEGYWNARLEENQRAPNSIRVNYQMAVVYAQLRDPDNAFLCLQKAYEGRFTDILSLKVDADLDPLRSDPRFQELMRRVGLP